MSPPQRLRAGLLRGCLRLLFRGLVRPPMPVALQRGVLRGLSLATLGAGGVVRERRSLAGVPCEWLRPRGVEARRRVLYLHGGAYLIGSPATHRAITTHLARRCAAEVCAVDYRRAPEHPFPAARDDALAVYLALLEAGHSPRRLLLAGDSAGGHLALSLALELKARGLPLPAGLLLFSPWTDLGCQRLHTPAAGDPLLSRAWLESAVRLLLPADAEPGSAALSPLHADLAGLPPLLVQVGEDELLRDDSLRLAQRAGEQGVAVRLQRYAGCWHVFQAHAGVLASADRMGVRLLGPRLECRQQSMISEGIALGAVQVPPDGQPIVLLNDRQTIGGYPRLGALAPLALARLAQCLPGQRVRLLPTVQEAAHREHRRLLAAWDA
ncbi:alpha/beta hydrolase fold domain-containing protein [Pseudomonas aeruginosa]|uniref:alpha/beta hydrolase fold domain-containing protein n=43 Tax=Pseudomonas aeruginosa TaxID=287 RepID=UPI0027D3CD3B|nr:alpha/beta hydrolase fold domain-containing protein [Pseudomonas aeruginosa]MDQ4251944.1 alpha/beta hydrolase fold domain-containing protein [Pseudomonas aeruginosa]